MSGGSSRRERVSRHVTGAMLAAALATFPLATSPLAAQAPPAGATAAARADEPWSAPGPLVRGRDLATFGAFALASAALMPLDERITHWSQRPALQRNAGLQRTATVFRVLGNPGALGIAVTTYGAGLLAHDRPTADVGLHGTEALAVGSALTALVKGTLGRARPYAVHDSTSGDYAFGRGFRRGDAYASLPSGHATAAFALATVVSREAAHRRPQLAHVVTPVAYGAATLVALSRIYNDKHWASDVALGAGIGTLSALTVVRFQHAHPDNALDRRLLPAASPASTADARTARPRRAGTPVAFSWTLHFR